MEDDPERTQTEGGLESKKKPRRRMKAVYAKIREQMEFYFSDANLHKDRFLKKAIDDTTDGYIALDIFLKFNKIKQLASDAGVIADALCNKSDMLEVNTEKTHVRRSTPIKEPVNVDERTVYVESIPHNVDHEWVKKLFSSCGKVAYVSIPRYPSTGDLKGFAFVEFETVEGAQTACQELHNPPAELTHRVGMFPKTSRQMDSLRKKMPEDQIKETEEKAKGIVLSGNEEESVFASENQQNGKESENTKESKSKRRRTNSESDVASSDGSPAKKRKAEVSFDLPLEEQKSKEEKTTPTTPTTPSKKKSRKRKSKSKTTESDEAKEETDLDKNNPEKKQKLSDKSELGDKDQTDKMVDDRNTKEEGNKETVSKKKRRHRRKKTKKDKEIPELRVIPKKEWLLLREEYLKLQKTSMALLKKTLGEHDQSCISKDNTEEDKPKRKEIEFIPDVIVKVSSEKPMTRKNLKGALGDKYQIAYIELKDEHYDGYIRCSNSDSAKSICNLDLTDYTFTPVTGDDEKQYWDKLKSDREAKLNTKCPHKKRGHQRWMDKAQKASMANAERKHILFTDD